MSHSQQQYLEPHCVWGSSHSTCTGVVQFPANFSMPFSNEAVVAATTAAAKANEDSVLLSPSPPVSVSRKRGRAWTEEEHKLFLIGLEEFGKGDWKNISRISVQSKTPSQVASHAQKYFIRIGTQEKKRKSIHDITLNESDHILLSRSINHHNLVPLPQNQCLEIASKEWNPHYTNHQNLIFRSQHGYLDIPQEVSNPKQVLVPHCSNHQNWFALNQNLDIEIMQLPIIPNYSDHQNWSAPNEILNTNPTHLPTIPHSNDYQNWSAPTQNLDRESMQLPIISHSSDHQTWFADPMQNLDKKPMQLPTIPHSTYHQNCFASIQNLETTPMKLPTIPHSSDHQDWFAPVQNLDTKPMLFPTIPHSIDHQTSIISPQNWDLPSENWTTNPIDIGVLLEQQPLSLLPPNKFPLHQKNY
ncbi:hypothetical protein Lal_00023059 [Lupinus albus]|nr:hypothetical protein Lal_00023059 [Lupinus albus]